MTKALGQAVKLGPTGTAWSTSNAQSLTACCAASECFHTILASRLGGSNIWSAIRCLRHPWPSVVLAWSFLWVLHAFRTTQGQETTCTSDGLQQCYVAAVDVSAGCTTDTEVGFCFRLRGDFACFLIDSGTDGKVCDVAGGCTCAGGVCLAGAGGGWYVCPDGSDMCDDPHMKGLRGQKIDWSGIDGGWYNMVKDDHADLHINVRLIAPLPEEFPDRQLMTGLSVLSGGHSLVIEEKTLYDVNTIGCPRGVSPCLANGGVRAVVDGEEAEGLLRRSRGEYVMDGITVLASNLPAECRQFGGTRFGPACTTKMLQGTRELAPEEPFEDWILRFDDTAAPSWCTQYIEQHDLAELHFIHSVFNIVTSAVTVCLNVGTNCQGDGDVDWDGRVLPDLEFWQMDVGLHGLNIENKSLTGILGETARPVLGEDGREVVEGYEAFCGTFEDYRVSGPVGTKFALLDKKEAYEKV